MNLRLTTVAGVVLVTATINSVFAQSSVTIYGRLDMSAGSRDTGAGSKAQAISGALTTPRLGFRGTEDLGGGLKANFQLEQRINLNTGANTNSRMFHGASTVGLSGPFGQIRAGRMLTVYDDVRGLANMHNVFDGTLLSPSFTTAYKLSSASRNDDYSSRPNNQLRYDTPKFGGFSGSVMYAFEQTAGKGDAVLAYSLNYQAGNLEVALGHQNEKSVNRYTTLAGAYNFGAFAVSAGYNVRDGATAAAGDDNEYNIGIEVPISGALKLSAGYASSKTKNVTQGSKSTGFGLGGTYALSKRTRLYAGYTKVEEKMAGKVSGKDVIFAAGVRHDF